MGYKRYDCKTDKLTILFRAHELNGTSLGKIIGCSYCTAKRRIGDPAKLTVAELRKLMKKLPKEEILMAL